MQSTATRTLDITIFSCEDLRIDGRCAKKNTYVVVRTDPLNSRTTKIDVEGGSYPYWNEKLTIGLPLHERFVTLEAHCKTTSGDRIIASARMPVSDFMDDFLPMNYLNLLSYRLRDARGQKNGIINLSVKVNAPDYYSKKHQFPDPKSCYSTAASGDSKSCNSMAYATACGNGGGGDNKFGVVTGVPVWSASYM